MGKKLTVKQKAKNKVAYKQIRAVWEEKASGLMTYKKFKKLVLNRSKGTGESIKESAKKIGNSYSLGTGDYKKQAKENLLSSMKEKFRATYDELRRKAGRYNKGEHLIDRVEWDAKEDAYVLISSTGDKFAIRTDQSPKNMYLSQI